MKEYSLDKYKFYKNKNTTIAISTYGGREVKGYAKLDPRDEYDEQFGMELAAARCNAKIAAKRAKRAQMKLENAVIAMQEAHKNRVKMEEYFQDSAIAKGEAEMQVENLLRSHGVTFENDNLIPEDPDEGFAEDN